MNHFALPSFWQHYRKLPGKFQSLADEKFELLKIDPRHPSLHFKRIGNPQLWSVRVGLHYRALGRDYTDVDGVVWYWIGTHAEYDAILREK